MKLTLILVGNTHKEYQSIFSEYVKRISYSHSLNTIYIKEEKSQAFSNEQIMEKEGKKILERISVSKYVISLDRTGKQLSSIEFSDFLQNRIEKGQDKEICFIIGGAYGLCEQVLKNSNYILSLSKMTFPHQLARILILEQIYRAFEIVRGSKYHK